VKTLNSGWDPVVVDTKPKTKHSGAGGKKQVTDEELRQIIKKKFSTLIAAFRSFDRNGDGSVNKREFAIGLKQSGVDLPPKLVDRIWKMADTDGTGSLA
jgi:Ca2+-binding EF-hand superfamily protein